MFNSVAFPDAFFQHVVSKEVDSAEFSNHQHTFYEILLIVKGSGTFLIENKRYAYEDRTLFMVAPGFYHVMTPPKQNYERFILHFSPRYVPPELSANRCIQIKLPNQLYVLFSKYDEYADQFDHDSMQLLLRSFLTEVLVLLTNADYGQIAPTKFPPLIKSAIDLIMKNLDQPMTTKSLAEQLFVSQSYLKNLFTKTMHVGIIEYVRMKKMFYAQEMLKQGDSVADVAQALGYSSYPTFLRNYRDTFHCNPSSVKKSVET